MIAIHLPALNASLNGVVALLLVAGLICVKQRQLTWHKICMISALAVSTLFLVSYLYYHYHHGTTLYPGTGLIRKIYFTILISHTILAAAVPFLAIRTAYLAFTQRWDKHIRLARITFPIWLYVAITGVVIYLMLWQ
jgi:putative membrane protein